MDPELEELPTDYATRPRLPYLAKQVKAALLTTSSSKWARKESALTEAEQAAIEQYGLFDLSTFLPKQPGEVELKVIKEMFEASVDGQSYDTERWGQYFRPAGVNAPAGTTATATTSVDEDAPAPVAVAKPAPVTSSFDDEDEPAVASAPVEAKPATQKAEDILAMIRARQKQ
jgi:hypothetical protein